jgi:hypothetical protein
MDITHLAAILGPSIFLYLGPETILPLGSIVAALIGVVLIGWRWIIAFFRKAYYKVTGKVPPSGDTHSTSQPEDTADQARN